MDLPGARYSFIQAIALPDEQLNLAEAALYIAQEEEPSLDVLEYLNALDTMADEVRERLPQERYPLRVIKVLNQYLYEDLGFRGNTTDYYDPRNSFLNHVIDRRTGIPITLSLVYLELARRIDFPMVGIGMPGHFLIRPTISEMDVYVDPFYQGNILFPEDCRERLQEIYNQPIPLQPELLQPVSQRRLLARMLTNLKMIYLNQGELQKCLAAVERILLLFPETTVELRDRGILHYHLGNWGAAAWNLQSYLDKSPDAKDASSIRQLLEQMRS